MPPPSPPSPSPPVVGAFQNDQEAEDHLASGRLCVSIYDPTTTTTKGETKKLGDIAFLGELHGEKKRIRGEINSYHGSTAEDDDDDDKKNSILEDAVRRLHTDCIKFFKKVKNIFNLPHHHHHHPFTCRVDLWLFVVEVVF